MNPGPAAVAVSTDDPRWTSTLAEIEDLVTAAASAALAGRDLADPSAEVSVVLADDNFVQSLNRVYRKIDKPTNVLAFPTGSAKLLGDVILAFETVRREAEHQGKSLGDHAVHLVVHGVLHLLGFDHETDSDADIMEREEARILAGLGIRDPYEAAAIPGAAE